MPLLKAKQKAKRLQLRVAIAETIFEEVKSQCKWLEIDKYDEFFEQAAANILSRDKDWLIAKDNTQQSNEK